MTRAGHLASLILLGAAIFGCEKNDSAGRPRAEIGIFYGGQVQLAEQVEVSKVSQPKLGFRVHLGEAKPKGEVRFELVRPGPAGRRVTKKGNFSVEPGQEQVDHLFEIEPSPQVGIFNVRVTYGDLLLADRAIYVQQKAAGSL